MYFCVISTLGLAEEDFFFVLFFYVCRKINGLNCKSELIQVGADPFRRTLVVCLIGIMSDNRNNGSCLVQSPLERRKPVACAYVSAYSCLTM